MEKSLINPLKEAHKEYFEDYLYHANKNGLKKICRELLSENEQLKQELLTYKNAICNKECAEVWGESERLKEENEQLKQQIEKMKADRWHYVADGDLPKDSETMCIFLSSNTYGEGGVPIFNKSNLNYHFGFYSFYMDENGDETSEPCWYDVNDDEEIDPMEVYAWQEIELPTMELR